MPGDFRIHFNQKLDKQMDYDGFIVSITYAFKLFPRIVILWENSCTLGVTFDTISFYALNKPYLIDLLEISYYYAVIYDITFTLLSNNFLFNYLYFVLIFQIFALP